MTNVCGICKAELNKYNPGICVKCPTTGEKFMFCQKCHKEHHKEKR